MFPQPAAMHDPKTEDLVMLVRQRKSRIYFLRRFFDYPISLTAGHLQQSGPGAHRSMRLQLHALGAAARSARRRSLEDFLINRFGKQLYLTFFKSYTEKVWGVPCNEISAEWGAQRIKGLSLKGVVMHFLKKTFGQEALRRYCAEADRNLADREVSLSQASAPASSGSTCRIWFAPAAAKFISAFAIDRIHIDGNSVVCNRRRQRSRRARDLLPAIISSPPCRSAT